MKNIITILFCFIAISSYTQIVTDRPDQTESSSTVPKGALQIESGILLNYLEDDNFTSRQILAPTNLFRLGLSDKIELRLLSQFESLNDGMKTTSGISDLELGFKLQLFKQEDNNTEVAFISHLGVPSGTKNLTGDEYYSINKLSVSHSMSETFSLGYNLGYNYFGQGHGDLFYSLSLGFSINDHFGIYIEPFGDVPNIEFGETILNFDGGLTYLPNKNIQLDFSFGSGINQRMNYLSLGCSWLIPKKIND